MIVNTVVRCAVYVSKYCLSMLSPETERGRDERTIGVGELAWAMLEIVFPEAIVHRAVTVFLHTWSVLQSLYEISFINTSILVLQLSLSRF